MEKAESKNHQQDNMNGVLHSKNFGGLNNNLDNTIGLLQELKMKLQTSLDVVKIRIYEKLLKRNKSKL